MRGRYRKREARVEGDNLACAWTLGDARSFAGARSRCLEGIVFDPKLSGAQHRVLAHCLKHMNAGARWSCFVSIPRLAEEAECSETTCWRALHDADGTHILTKRGTHACHDVTFVTIHPNYKLSNLRSCESKKGDKLSNLNEQACKFASTSFQKCEENFLTRTSIKEPPADQSYYWKWIANRERRKAESLQALNALRKFGAGGVVRGVGATQRLS
jgi:hypothetical protein